MKVFDKWKLFARIIGWFFDNNLCDACSTSKIQHRVIRELAGIIDPKEKEEKANKKHRMVIPTMLSIVEEYPIDFNFDNSKAIEFLESLYGKKVEDERTK